MKYLITIFLIVIAIQAKSNNRNSYVRLKYEQINNIVVRYEPGTLRIPGNKLKIGISAFLQNGDIANTRGYLDGKTSWLNYIVEVEGGQFCSGRITIDKTGAYDKQKYLNLKIYHRKTKKLLRTQSIPLNYELDIKLLPKSSFKKAPGERIELGLQTTYDNERISVNWLSKSKSIASDYTFYSDGGVYYNGALYINSDPFAIQNHRVYLSAYLKKNPEIADTFSIVLDYRAHYSTSISAPSGMSGSWGSNGSSGSTGCNGGDGSDGGNGSGGYHGTDLNVYADVYYDTIIHEELMFLELFDIERNKKWHYLINTDGGKIRIANYGGSGGSGGFGGTGGSGGNGQDGAWYTVQEKINDSTYKDVQYQYPGGNGGNGGYGGNGGAGGNGGDGGNIFVFYTNYAQLFLNLIDAKSISGSGGSGGMAGSGGSGGSGGAGDPKGRSGSSGNSGNWGPGGYSGRPGIVEYLAVDESSQE